MKTVQELIIAAWLCLGAAAHAQVVVVTSAKSAATKLDKKQVVDLYLGNSRELPGVGQAQLLASSPPLRDDFYAKVLEKEASQVKAIWSRLVFSGKGIAPRELSSAAEIKAALVASPNALAFIAKADVDASVKVLFEL